MSVHAEFRLESSLHDIYIFIDEKRIRSDDRGSNGSDTTVLTMISWSSPPITNSSTM